MSRLVPPTAEVHYPDGDGKPMAETGIHVQAIMWLFQALEVALARAGEADAFIAANMYWYWREGDPKKRVAPDLMVVPGAGRHHRRSFKSWAEGGRVPALVVEVSSDKTAEYDRGKKRRRYRALGVSEYVLFDPDGRYLPEPLMGYRLDGTRYRKMDPADGRLTSRLGFGLAAEGMMLRLFDGRTGEPIPTWSERAEADRLQVADARRMAADAERVRVEETAQLAAEVERLKARLGDT